jgi:hypothetical protein
MPCRLQHSHQFASKEQENYCISMQRRVAACLPNPGCKRSPANRSERCNSAQHMTASQFIRTLTTKSGTREVLHRCPLFTVRDEGCSRDWTKRSPQYPHCFIHIDGGGGPTLHPAPSKLLSAAIAVFTILRSLRREGWLCVEHGNKSHGETPAAAELEEEKRGQGRAGRAERTLEQVKALPGGPSRQRRLPHCWAGGGGCGLPLVSLVTFHNQKGGHHAETAPQESGINRTSCSNCREPAVWLTCPPPSSYVGFPASQKGPIFGDRTFRKVLN